MTSPDFPTFLLRELWSAYLAARKGKKHTIDEHRFELNDMENLIDLRDIHRYLLAQGLAGGGMHLAVHVGEYDEDRWKPDCEEADEDGHDDPVLQLHSHCGSPSALF